MGKSSKTCFCLGKTNFYLNDLAIADMAISIGFVVVVPVVVPITLVAPIRVLVLMGMAMRMTMVAMST